MDTKDAAVADDDEPTSDASTTDPTRMSDAGVVDAGEDAGSGPGDDGTDGDAGVDVTDPARCKLDETALGAAALWSSSWNFHYDDPEGDDQGMGSYAYPSKDLNGAADIRQIDFAFDVEAERLSFEVGVTTLEPETRIGALLWDRTSFEAELSNLEWALSGVELRVPNWSKSGVATVLALPKAFNPLYDLTRKLGSADGQRPDNALFIQTNDLAGNPDVKWMDCVGQASNDPSGIMELDVLVDQQADPPSLRFSMPAAALSSYLRTRDDAGGLTLVVYSFLVVSASNASVDAKLNEYGAFEMTGQLGGLLESTDEMKAWRDPDVYDIAFVDLSAGDVQETAQQKQNDVLTPAPAALNESVDIDKHVVILTESSAGVAVIDTAGGGG